VLDFTASLYLGFRHPSSSLAPWASLTIGVPTALGTPAENAGLAAAVASLLGCARAALAPSTLHLFWDLFPLLAGTEATIHVDAGAYPIGRWGAERVGARGVPARIFRHHDPEALRHQLRTSAGRRRRPLVLADGYCPGCGPAPVAAYGALAERFGGWLVIDDTQAVGVLGAQSGPDPPWGRGGGGSLRANGMEGPHLVVCASLAKAFGVPVAVLAGDAAIVERYERFGEARVHCSQPSMAALRATERALVLNRAVGDAARARLVRLLHRFRTGSARAGVSLRGGIFPVQTLQAGPRAPRLHRRLLALGVKAVLHRPSHGGAPVVSFVLTARHTDRDIDAAVAALECACGHCNDARVAL
jgi:8-amino-7-oxononanoate synthase